MSATIEKSPQAQGTTHASSTTDLNMLHILSTWNNTAMWHVNRRHSHALELFLISHKHLSLSHPENLGSSKSEPLNFPDFCLPDIMPSHPGPPPTGHLAQPDICCSSQGSSDVTDPNIPDLQLSSDTSSSDTEAEKETDFSTESFQPTDPHLSSLQSSSRSDVDMSEKYDQSQLATELLVSLCTSHTPEVILNLYKFHQEAQAQLMSTGPDVTPNSVVDITFDSTLNATQFIKYLQGSKVPHQTIQVLFHVRDSCTFSNMQTLYHNLTIT